MISTNSDITKVPGQSFHFLTKEAWEKEKQNFPQYIQEVFSAKEEEVFIYPSNQELTFFIGLGKQQSLHEKIFSITQKFSFKYSEKFREVPTMVLTPGLDNNTVEEILFALFLGSYQYPFKKNSTVWNKSFTLIVTEFPSSKVVELTNQIESLCTGQFLAMDWLNKPANEKSVDAVLDVITNLAQKHNWNIKTLRKEECAKDGLGAFLAVSKASTQDPAFTIIEYQSKSPEAKTIGLVGKCVLFDTGGISLKNPENMHYMKSDMGGATAVLGALVSASLMELPVNIVAILPITDNLISSTAYLPSDVVKAYNGKTIEILNTDAEGRLTLADALSYLTQNYKTDYLLDLATLTGSAVRMFGDRCGALFSNDPQFQEELISVGKKSMERLWPLPLWEEWGEEIKSDVADLKNISLKPIGDCIVAANFLSNFINEHPRWAHLDIAGVAFGSTSYAKEKAATGYGVRLLVKFMQNCC